MITCLVGRRRASDRVKPTRMLSRATIGFLIAVSGCIEARTAWCQQFDSATPRQARRLLNAAQYQSSIHKIDDAVPVVAHTYLFTGRTNWGPLSAYGYDALVIKLRELYAIQALEDTSKTEAYGKALGRAAGAPVRMIENIVTKPGATIGAVPRGIGSFFERIGESVTSSGKNDDNMLEAATGSAARKRQIAFRFNVSPYSSNKVLQDKIGDLARAEAFGALTMSVATMAMPGGVGMVFTLGRTSENMSALLRDRTPAELREINYDTLRDLNIPVEAVRRFLANPSYDPGKQTHLVQSLAALRGARQLDSYLGLASVSESEDDAFLYQRIAQMMAGYHRSVAQIDNVGVIYGLPVALSVNRDALVFFPLDELVWTAKSAQTAAAFEKIVNPLQPRRKELWLGGRASALAKKELGALGWAIQEGARGKLYDIM